MNPLDIILHIDTYLDLIIQNYGSLTYLLLFVIIFLETGFVLTPFLPGDSLLFAAGAFAARGSFNIVLLFVLFWAASVLGDTVNYFIGRNVGPKVFRKKTGFFFREEHLTRTHAFYEKYGGKTILLARFIPIVRTFAPFVAGIGQMPYGKFLSYNVIGGLFWVLLFAGAGYWFGNVSFVKNNFSLVILVIIVLSLIPAVWEWMSHRRRR
jgi:membrane-associated protein